MKTLVFLLALVGHGLALNEAQTHFEYEYSARIGSSIPSTRSKLSAAGLKVQVHVYMHTEKDGIVHLLNPQVGEYLGDVSCDMREPVPIKYQPMTGQGKTEMETPFEVHFAAVEGTKMKVLETEELWVTNIKKSIVNNLRNAVIRSNFGKVEGDEAFDFMSTRLEKHAPLTFNIEEDTILGRCLSRYSVNHYPHFMGIKLLDTFVHEFLDLSDISEGETDMWKVTRTIDFEHCQDVVALQHKSTGNTTFHNNEFLQSRTSVSQFIVSGTFSDFHLMAMINEGSGIVRNYGYESSEIETHTNQTMVLVDIDFKSAPVALPSAMREVLTWKYEVESEYKGKADHDWILFRMGEQDAPLDYLDVVSGVRKGRPSADEQKAKFIEMFEMAIDELVKDPQIESHIKNPYQTKAGHTVYPLTHCSMIAKRMTKQDLRDVFETIYNKQTNKMADNLRKMLIVDVIAASGSRNAGSVLLEKLQEKKISHTRAATVFMTYVNNAYNFNFKDKQTMDFIESLDLHEDPFFATSAYINIAQLAHRHCVNYHHKNFSIPYVVLGETACHRREVVDVLMPFFFNKLEETKHSWEKAVFLQAIGNLGLPEAINKMKPYIYGQKDLDSTVRNTAMYALGSWKLPPFARTEVFEVLMPIVNNVGELPEIRQRALKVLLSWNPESEYWNALASMTWYEPSRQVATFIYSTIYTTATLNDQIKGNQYYYAKNALKLAKPFVPSLRYSFNLRTSHYNRIGQFMPQGELTWITNRESVIPEDVDLFFTLNLGGYNYKIFDIVAHNEGLNEIFYYFLDHLRENFYFLNEGHNVHNSDARASEDIYDKFLQAVEMEYRKRTIPHGAFYMKFFENMQQYFHFNSETMNKLTQNGKLITSLLSNSIPIHLTKYIEPISSLSIVATDVGLPLVYEFGAPMIHMAEGNVKVTVDGSDKPTLMDIVTAKGVHFNVDVKYRVYNKMYSFMKVILPWKQRMIAAGIEQEKQFNLPLKFSTDFVRNKEEIAMKINYDSISNHKYPVIYSHNLPCLAEGSMWATADHKDYKFEIINVDLTKDEPLTEVKRSFGSKFTGIEANVEYNGDYYYPLHIGDFRQYFMRYPDQALAALFGLNHRQYQFSLNVDPQQSKTKKISLKLSYISENSHIDGKTEEVVSAKDSSILMYHKLKHMFEQYGVNEYFRLLRAHLSFNQDASQPLVQYDTFTAIEARQPRDNQESLNVIFGLLSNDNSADHNMCIALKAKSPVISNEMYLLDMLKKNVHVDVEGHINKCQFNQDYITANVDFKLSEERKQQLMKEENRHTCVLRNCLNPMNGYPTDAVYDRADAKVTFTKDMPDLVRNATYMIGDVMRGAMYPNIYFNYFNINNKEGEIMAHGERPLESNFWKFYAHFPHKEVIVERFHIPKMVDMALPLGGARTPSLNLRKTFMAEPTYDTQCVIEKEQVRTFDGHLYHMEHNIPCWTVATRNRSDDTHDWVLETRYHGDHLETRLTHRVLHTIVELKDDEVKVNNEVKSIPVGHHEKIFDGHKNVILYITNRDGHYYVEVPHQLKVYMKDNRAYIRINYRYKGHAAGLCGDFNEEHLFEMVGPKYCLYIDPDTFVKSWVSEETDCPKYAEYKSTVAEYQTKPCLKAPNEYEMMYRTGEYMGQHFEGQKYVYAIQEIPEEDMICVQKDPSRHCKTESNTLLYEYLVGDYKCFKTSEAPSEVKSKAKNPGYLEHPAMVEQKTIRQIYTRQAAKCKEE